MPSAYVSTPSKLTSSASFILDEVNLNCLSPVLNDGLPYLQAENEMYPDLIPVRELVIQGVMVALLRQGEGKVA